MKSFEILETKREIFIFLSVCFLIFSINFTYSYFDYKNFINEKFVCIEAKLEKIYDKKYANRSVKKILKLKYKDFTFYTRSSKNLNFKEYQTIKLTVITSNLKFKDYFKKRFFLPSFNISLVKKPLSIKDKMINFITNQHENKLIKELYSTLYFATNISKDLRDSVTNWGIAHIISISGFHIGIIFSFVFFIFAPIYKFFQNRYFPYRNLKLDLSVFVFVFLTFYLFILDFTPSFLRSLFMSFIAFYFLINNIKIINFKTLFITIFSLIAIFPELIFSIGFYFSSMGVLCIFIFLKHFSSKFSLFFDIVIFNFYIFFAMNIIVYYFFPTITFLQISVIPLGYIFVIFYPVSIVLHLLNFGYIFDEYLINFLNFNLEIYKTNIPLILFLFSNFISILAIKYKIFAIILPIIGILPIVLI